MFSLLERQIRRHLGDPATLPAQWRDFLAAVDQAYEQADRDRSMIEHSLDLMSQELTERNRDLLRELSEKQKTEAALQFEKNEQSVLIDKLEAAHNQLLQAEKMASIGQLAAGVAHEINNPIGYVQSNIGSLEDYLGGLFRILDAYAAAEAEMPADQPAGAELKRLKAELDLAFLRQDIPQLMNESKEGISRVRKIVQ
ncbi:MAG TPA: histidine kinase, partial [Rhodocyclaceae bacterium]|nr:histidine kinase [Rhodocyclaceae bacterium]